MSANGVGGGGGGVLLGIDVSTALPMYNLSLTTNVNVPILPIMSHTSDSYHTSPNLVMTEEEKWMEIEQAALLRQNILRCGESMQQLRSAIAKSETEHAGEVSALQGRIRVLEAQATLQLEHESKVSEFQASIAALETQAAASQTQHAGFEQRIAELQTQNVVSKDKMQFEKGKHKSYKNQWKAADSLCKTLEATNAQLRAAANA